MDRCVRYAAGITRTHTTTLIIRRKNTTPADPARPRPRPPPTPIDQPVPIPSPDNRCTQMRISQDSLHALLVTRRRVDDAAEELFTLVMKDKRESLLTREDACRISMLTVTLVQLSDALSKMVADLGD